MLFSSCAFLFVFLPIVLLGYYILFRGKRRAQNLFLLLASLFFYAWGSPVHVLLMLLSIAMNYAFGMWVHRWKRLCRYLTTPVAAAVAANLIILFLFKYLDFTAETLNLFGANLPLPGIELPIGISFFTFQALSYVLDVAMGRTQVQRSPLALGLYISFFPQLIAGPIVKYGDFSDQIEGRKESWADFSAGCTRFLTGLGKKVLLANQLALVANKVFALSGEDLSTPLAWIGSICYSFQIYYDFSGYSDMAIGLGLLFGFRFKENFDHPYSARSITDFWRRWHISLSTWFRDYIYIPLGGNRVERGKNVRNLFVVWLLTGIWHGANWTFILWGLLYFLLLICEKYLHFPQKCPGFLYRIFTLLMVNFLWMLFRAENLEQAGTFLASMLGMCENTAWSDVCTLFLQQNVVVLFFAVLFSMPAARWCRERVDRLRDKKFDFSLVFDVLYAFSLIFVGIISVSCLVKGSYNPFIYFNF